MLTRCSLEFISKQSLRQFGDGRVRHSLRQRAFDNDEPSTAASLREPSIAASLKSGEPSTGAEPLTILRKGFFYDCSATRGRVYLPQDELAKARLSDDDIFRGKVTDKWRKFMKGQIKRARMFFDEAEKGVAELNPASRHSNFFFSVNHRNIKPLHSKARHHDWNTRIGGRDSYGLSDEDDGAQDHQEKKVEEGHRAPGLPFKGPQRRMSHITAWALSASLQVSCSLRLCA
ncbi:hypothetical protein LR48_Vigan07g176200 [Vigna angularis]|uniref:15-cis-phytoene synthase n=1 Tax=Phaseolus angularis TaxID=3914 RepID=A0A0L9UZ63_PHAAN|nr:hypothetical protein LR48_Vigan07g176200 [Vigna angularis]